MVETAKKTQADGRVCFVCQGTGSLSGEQSSLRSILNTMQNTGQHSAPKTNGPPIEELSKLEREKVRLEKHKRSLLKTIECVQRHQNIIKQKRETLVKSSVGNLLK